MKRHITDNTYRGYKINCGEEGKSSCNKLTLDQCIDRMEYMISKHSKVQVVRLDLHQPIDSDKPLRKEMTRIIEKANRTLNAKSKGNPNKIDMHYIWRAEQNGSEHEHVHAVIMANGNAIQNGYSLWDSFNEALKSQYNTNKDGLVEFCESNDKYGKRIERGSDELKKQMDEASYQMSYIAKGKYDKNRPKGGRISSASRLPKKDKNN